MIQHLHHINSLTNLTFWWGRSWRVILLQVASAGTKTSRRTDAVGCFAYLSKVLASCRAPPSIHPTQRRTPPNVEAEPRPNTGKITHTTPSRVPDLRSQNPAKPISHPCLHPQPAPPTTLERSPTGPSHHHGGRRVVGADALTWGWRIPLRKSREKRIESPLARNQISTRGAPWTVLSTPTSSQRGLEIAHFSSVPSQTCLRGTCSVSPVIWIKIIWTVIKSSITGMIVQQRAREGRFLQMAVRTATDPLRLLCSPHSLVILKQNLSQHCFPVQPSKDVKQLRGSSLV